MSALNTLKRACDACHRRKVKCVGEPAAVCRNCISAGLSCTYNSIPQKKGPKGSRAKVISELRENQRRRASLPFISTTSPLLLQGTMLGADGTPGSPVITGRLSGLLTLDLINQCVDYFFENLYPTQPILHRESLQETTNLLDESLDAYCMLSALCGYMLIQPNMKLSDEVLLDMENLCGVDTDFGRLLVEETTRVRKFYNYVDNPTVLTVITSFFLFGSYFGLGKDNLAWFHMREATTFAHLMGMQSEEAYRVGHPRDICRKRRLYWLLLVTERAYALQRHRPLTLHATIALPTPFEEPDETVELTGFIHLVNLFHPFDDTFVGLWNKNISGATVSWIAQLQAQLADALPVYLKSTETQAVDLRVSQQWLKVMIWQLSINQGLLSSSATDSAMGFRFPIEASRDLVMTAADFSIQAMEVHGIGLVEKLFDVACTLTDVMSVVPISPPRGTFELGPRDYLNQFLNLIASLRGGQTKYLPVLLHKIDDMLPSASLPYPQGVPSVPGPSASAAVGRSGIRLDQTMVDSERSGSTHQMAVDPFGSPLARPSRISPTSQSDSNITYGSAAAMSFPNRPDSMP